MAWLEENLRVETGDHEYMRIVLAGEPVEEMVVMLTAVAQAYQDATLERERGRSITRMDELRKVHAELRKEVDRYQQKIDEIALVLEARNGQLLAIVQELRVREFQICHESLARVRRERAVLAATLAAGPDVDREAATVDGGPVRAVAPPRKLRPEETPEGRRLAAEERWWAQASSEVSALLSKENRYARELENIRRDIRAKEAVAERVAAEIERCQIELRAPPRITLVEEPSPLPAP